MAAMKDIDCNVRRGAAPGQQEQKQITTKPANPHDAIEKPLAKNLARDKDAY